MRQLKLVVAGDGAVGKTCLLIVYSTGKFPTDYVPTVFDNYSVKIVADGEQTLVDLWDTAGQETLDSLRLLSYPGSDLILICFGIDNPVSYGNVKSKWFVEVTKHCPGKPIILVGTKCDLRDDPDVIAKLKKDKMLPVTELEGEKLAKEINAAAYMECSAKEQDGVKEVFDTAITTAIKGMSPQQMRELKKKKGCVMM